MYLLSVEESFDAAHCLRNYGGKCERLHGHRFKVVVRLKASRLNSTGLAYDFTDLKLQLKEVLSAYDHQNLSEIRPFDRINPSSENIATVIYKKMAAFFTEDVKLDAVEVWESPQSCAVYRPGKA